MALSKNWTYAKFWREAALGKEYDPTGNLEVARFEIINRAIECVANQFYDLMAIVFMRPVTIVPDTLGRYYVSGASWNASLSQLTATMDTNFGSGDVGKLIVFRVGPLVYDGQVTAFISTTVVTVTGSNLPATNQTVDYVMLVSTTPTGNTIYIGDLKYMRSGQQIRLELESTATQFVKNVSSYEVRTFRASAGENVDRIVWALSGEEILLAKGSNIATYGTFTLRYPGTPINGTLDAQYIDLPDGAPMEIALLKARLLIAELGGPAAPPDADARMKVYIEMLYKTYAGEVSAETVVEKVKALK